MLVRCTARLLVQLDNKGCPYAEDAPTAGDWYANLLWIDRRKCLIVVHAGTLFPVFLADVRKTDLRRLGHLVTGAIAEALADEGLSATCLGDLDPRSVHVAKTASRHVLGHMNDMALSCDHSAVVAGGLGQLDVADLNRWLRRGLHRQDGAYVVPLELVRRLAESSAPA